MLTGFLNKNKDECTFSLPSDSIKKVDAISSSWNLEREDAILAIIDIAHLLHDMGAFPSITSLGQTKQNKSNTSQAGGIHYDSLTKKQRISIKTEIKDFILKNTYTKEKVMAKYSISADATQQLRKQALLEIKAASKNGLDYSAIPKNNKKSMKVRINRHIELHGMPTEISSMILANNLGITVKALNQLLKQTQPTTNVTTSSKPTDEQLLNTYKPRIEKLLFEKGRISIANIAEALNAPQSHIRTCLNAMISPDGIHPIDAAAKSFVQRKTADILRLKREEIYTDEEIMDMLDLEERVFNSLLETLYK